MDKLLKDLLKHIDTILGPKGFITLEKGMRFSENQYDYAVRTAKGFCSCDTDSGKTSINMLEAATGTGKTLGYLVPLMLFSALTGKRVAVSTFTLQLQKQIMESDAQLALAWVEKVTKKRLSVARRVGISNYVSPLGCARMHDHFMREGADEHADVLRFLEDLQSWAEETDPVGQHTNSCLLDDFLDIYGLDAVPDAIPLRAIQLDKACPDEEQVPYNRDVTRAEHVDVLIVNHALVVLNAFRWASVIDSRHGRPVSVMVCDEADMLPGVAESMTSSDLPLHRLHATVTQFSKLSGKPEIAESVDELYWHVMSLKPPATDILALGEDNEIARLAEASLKSLRPIETMLARK